MMSLDGRDKIRMGQGPSQVTGQQGRSASISEECHGCC